VGMLRPLAVDDVPRPLVQGERPLARRLRGAGAPTAALCAGFALSAALIFAVAGFVGRALGVTLVPERARLAAAVLCCVALVGLDLLALRRHTMCPVTLRRQTPKNLVMRHGDTKGALIWGLDTGLSVTTFRVSAATWALLALGLLGVAPWWQGVAYAAGFCVPIAAAILLVPRRSDRPDGTTREPHWISRLLTRYRWIAQTCALLTALAAGTATVLALMA
jgi:cytochrome c biogenesis protein CcdA